MNGETRLIGQMGAERAFVTAVDDLAGITDSTALARRLTLVDEFGNLRTGPFGIIEFEVQGVNGISSPVFRSNPGFIGGGRTLGGAREFDIPNLQSSELRGVSVRIVGEATN
jgi:hypothetical protein